MRASISLSPWQGHRPGYLRLPGRKLFVQLLERPAQAVELIHEVKDDVDPLIIDAEIRFQIPDEASPRDIQIREVHFGGGLIRNQPALFGPKLECLRLDARVSEEFLLVHDHDVLPSRGLNALPLSQPATNASSSGSGDLGKTTLSLTT